MESEQHLPGNLQRNNSSGNEEGVKSVSKKARRKRRTGIPQNLPFYSCPVSFASIDDEQFDGSFCFRNPLHPEKPTIVEGSLQFVEERPERLLPQRRQGSRNQSPLPNKPSTAK